MILLLLSCARASADEPPPEYTRAVELGISEFSERNFLEARAHLTRAHGIYPNARTFRALGMVEFELKKYADSARFLQGALNTAERPLDGEKRAETEALLERAKDYLAFLTFDITPDTELWVDGAMIPLSSNEQLILGLGEHTLEFRAPGRVSQKRSLSIKGGEKQTLRVTLLPAAALEGSESAQDQERRPTYKNPWLWTALGVVVAGAAAATAIALTRDSDGHGASVNNGTGGRRPLVAPSAP